MLKESLRVLVVDDDEQISDMITGYLELCPLFSVTAVDSVDKARRAAAEGTWHCWMVDLYVPDIRDGMGLMEEFADQVPVMVMSGQSTGGEGYRCGQLNVTGFIDKSEIDRAALVNRVYRLALTRLLCANYPKAPTNKAALAALDLLFTDTPDTVTDWASRLQITARTLEQWMRECGPNRPNTILSLFQVYQTAFAHTSLDRELRESVRELAESVIQRYADRPARLRRLVLKAQEA